MGFWWRFKNTVTLMGVLLVHYYHLYQQQFVMDKYFRYPGWETRPPIGQLASNRSLVLINADYIASKPYPLAPHVKLIGGVNILPNKPLPEDLKNFMDGSPEGIIYFALGSNVKTSKFLNSSIGKSFFNVFNKFNHKVLMKWESDSPKTGLPKKIKTSSWIPQQDILAHKNCIMFITHGGFLSVIEATHYGVPFLGIPHFSDQHKNIDVAARGGRALLLERSNITEESLSWAFLELLQNPRYKEEARRTSRMLKDRRHTSLEEAIYWIEYVMKYPNSLTPASAYMSFIQMHNIDIKLLKLTILLVVIYIFYKIFRVSLNMFGRKPRKTKLKQK